jgi:hypothetical protein
MYNPRDILTEDGLDEYRMHLKNIENGLFYLENHADYLHIGAINGKQSAEFWGLIDAWKDLLPVLKTGDGEREDE